MIVENEDAYIDLVSIIDIQRLQKGCLQSTVEMCCRDYS